MRRSLVVVFAVLAILGMLAPPSFAQAPAPKVTINGLVDFVTSAYQNWSQNAGAPGAPDPTTGDKRGWYSRERGVFTLTGEVGQVKGVWAIELDFSNGAGNFGANTNTGSLNTVGTAAAGTTSPFNLDTDVKGAVETKWLYLETPVTGPGSLLPFIPVKTIGRFGGQPAIGHDYKNGILLSGDFPGATLQTVWSPNVRSTLTYVQIAEALDRGVVLNQKEDIALVASLEVDVFKGLTIKPTYAYAFYHGGQCGLSNLGTEAYGGYNQDSNCPPVVAGSVAGPNDPTNLAQHPIARDIERHYIGGDLRWTAGPFSFQPTLLYLLGTQDVTSRSGVVNSIPIRAFIVDTTAGFRTGPLNVEARAMYNPGVSANNDVQNAGGGVIRTYQPINSGYGYMAGWTEIWTGNIDYASSFLVNRGGLVLRQSPSYDKYGRVFVGGAVDYSLTPALTLRVLTNFSWTDTKVDTKGTTPNVFGITPSGITTAGNPFKGAKESYLGNEWVWGLTYRFAPNIAFDLAAAVLFSGDALNIARTAGGPVFEAKDVYKGTARFRFTF